MNHKDILANLKDLWKMDICIQILNSSMESATDSRIISTINMPTTVALDCLAVLVEIGFMDYDRDGENYRTTERGKRFATIFNEVLEAIRVEEQGAGPMYLNSQAES